jgi:hypothetical protein
VSAAPARPASQLRRPHWIDAYRADADVAARLSLLSTYLGHVHPANTYWYLSAAPELLALAGKRLERSLEELV